jgi:SPP1 gp7 family putative phage head morphogenesis protein
VAESAIQAIPQTIPSATKEVTSADSSWYWAYQLRPYNPDELYQKRGNYDLFDDMREDDQISACLSLKKYVTLNSQWEIRCEDEKIPEFLTYALNMYLNQPFIKCLYDMLSAMDYGFSITEKIVDIVETKEWGRKIVFTGLKTRAPHTFDIYTDKSGNVEYVIQHQAEGDVEIDPRKLIIYSYNKEFDNPYGKSELNKGVYRAWWSKDGIIKFWNMYLERFGMPTAVGKMPKAAGVADKDRFKQILKNIQAKTSITIPDDFTVELLEVSKGAGEYERAINKYDNMIARRMLIPDLMGFSGERTGGGSYSLGQEQFNIFYTIINYIREDLSRMINKEIIYPLVALNFGPQYQAEFVWTPIDDKKKESDMTLWLEAVKTGKIPVDEVQANWFLKQIGAPEVEIDEELMQETEAPKKEITQKVEEEPEETEKSESEVDEAMEENDDEGGDGKEYAAKLGTESVMAKDYAVLDEKWIPEIKSIVRLMINALIDDIKSQNIIEKRKLNKINDLSVKHGIKLRSAFRALLRESYRMGEGQIKRSFAAIDPTDGMSDEEIIEWIDSLAAYSEEAEKVKLLTVVKPIIIEGIRNNLGWRDVVAQIEDAVQSYGLSLGKDAASLTARGKEYRIETIVRTLTSKAMNEARLGAMQKLVSTDGQTGIVAYKYSAVMDGRTSPICQRLNGKIFAPAEAQKYNPPNHFSCRSALVPIFADEDYEMTPKKDMPSVIEEPGGFLELKK